MIDSIAGSGCLWDRCIANSDVPDVVFQRMVDRMLSNVDPGNGSVELLTDVQSIADGIQYSCFDRVDLVSADPATLGDVPETDQIDTQLGQLFASAIERDAEQSPWSLLWLHSGFLTNRWDGPREKSLIDHDLGELVIGTDDAPTSSADLPRSLFESVIPPRIELTSDDHPDLITSWMHTYGSQIQLLDTLLENLMNALANRAAHVVIAGTSGFRLGQGGWIGHHCGPLRSRDVHVPMIFSGSGPLRIPKLSSTDSTAMDIGQVVSGSKMERRWNLREDSDSIKIESNRSAQNFTTSDWFFVRDVDSSEHLFLKPDDIDDFNDVARLRPDVVSELNRA